MNLPIDELLPQIVARLRREPNLVIEAAPGAGKTTRVPPALLEFPQDVLVLEPRRIAARMAARRVADELIVIDSAWRPGVETDQWQERVLSDGSRHQVYKRYLSGTELAEEIEGEVLMDGAWFVVARVLWADQPASAGMQ